MTFPHPEPTPYHRMLRTWTYAPWKPVVGILIVVVGFFVVTAMVYIVIAGIFAAFEGGSWIDNFMASADLSHVGPEVLLGLNLGLGVHDPRHLVRDAGGAQPASEVADVRRTPHAVAVLRDLPRARRRRARRAGPRRLGAAR